MRAVSLRDCGFRNSANQALTAPNVAGGLNFRLPVRHRYDVGLKIELRRYFSGQESINVREIRIGVLVWQ